MRGSALAHGCDRGGRVLLPLPKVAAVWTGLRVLHEAREAEQRCEAPPRAQRAHARARCGEARRSRAGPLHEQRERRQDGEAAHGEEGVRGARGEHLGVRLHGGSVRARAGARARVRVRVRVTRGRLHGEG